MDQNIFFLKEDGPKYFYVFFSNY